MAEYESIKLPMPSAGFSALAHPWPENPPKIPASWQPGGVFSVGQLEISPAICVLVMKCHELRKITFILLPSPIAQDRFTVAPTRSSGTREGLPSEIPAPPWTI